MANNLYINDGKNNVSVGELAIVLDKQQLVMGNFERDFIIRTAGNIKVQVGNKLYDLPFTSTTDTTGTVTIVKSATTILNTPADLATLVYPGDGNYVYVIQGESFYIGSNGSLVLLTSQANKKVYLSYDSKQELSGTEKLTVTLNAGVTINQLSDVANFSASDVFPGQVVFSIAEGRHYRLVNTANPSLTASWHEIYLNLNGGTVIGPVGINIAGSVVSSNASLHLVGDHASTTISSLSTLSNVLVIGAENLSSGLAAWTNQGSVYLESLASKSSASINFITRLDNGSFKTPLSLTKNNVGIGGIANSLYTLTVNGSLYTSANATFNATLKSTGFLSGLSGVGFGLYPTGGGDYTLEVDNLLVRNKTSTYSTYGTNGAQIINYTLTVTEADYVEDIPIYITASVSGKYSDNLGVTIRPLSSKAMNAKVVRTSLATLSTNTPVKEYTTIRLSYAMGDIYDDTSTDTTTTWNQDAGGSFYTPVGDTSYNSGTMTFVPNVSGPLLLINTISVYFITCSSSTDIAVGDLLYFKQWDENKQLLSNIHAEVVVVESTGFYIYAYDSANITIGTQFFKVGNTAGTGSFMQLNASDLTSPFFELLTDVTSFNDFYRDYYYEKGSDMPSEELSEEAWSSTTNLRVKIGDLTNVSDTNLLLTGTNQYGLYSDNAYIKGNFVINHAYWPSMPTTTNLADNFIVMESNRLNQIDMSTKFAYWNAKADNTITITATGNGLTGGGDLTANRTFALDFTYLDSRYFSGSYAILETPTGALNGINTTFTLAHTPTANKEMVVLNGLILQRSVDYSISGTTLTLAIAPFSTDWLAVTYLY